MVRPTNFGFNLETADSNSFQKKIELSNVQDSALSEFDAMVVVLCSAGIDVKIFEDNRKDTPDSIFPNNWIASLPSGEVTVFPMFAENRRKEKRKDIVDFVALSTQSQKLIDLSLKINEGKFLEGTGSIVFDYTNKIAYACESPRTDIALLESYCAEINYAPVSFQAVDLNGELIYHTNVVMTITSKCAIICLDALSNILEREMLIRKLADSCTEIVAISYSQMNSFAGNCFEVLNDKNESVLLMSTTALKSLKEEQLFVLRKYHQILAIDIPTIETVGGGGVRCMVAGIFKQR